MKRQVVDTMAKLLEFTGINVKDDKPLSFPEFSRISFYVFFLSYGYLGTITFSIINFGEFYNFVIPTAYIGALTVLMSGVLTLFYYKRKTHQLLKIMDNNVFIYPDEENIHPKYSWLFSERNIVTKFVLVMGYEITGYIFVCGSPFMGYFVNGHMKPYIYPGWTPWKVNGTISFWVTYASQVGVVTTSLWGYYLTLTYILFILIEFMKQNKRLAKAVSTINERAEKSTMNEFNHTEMKKYPKSADQYIFQCINSNSSEVKREYIAVYHKRVRENIVMCVQHHQRLKKIYMLFKSWFSIAFSIDLGACMSTYALVFYCLLEENDFERLASLIGVAFVAIANLFAKCVVGEIFSAMNENIAFEIFHHTDWANQNSENKRLISIFHSQVRRPMNLYGYAIFQASLLIFSNIIRTSYSYLNLIRASLNKE